MVGGSCTRPLARNPTVALDDKVITLGADQRVLKGDHTLFVDGTPYAVQLQAGNTTTLRLPVARRRCTADPLPTVATTDFGSTPTIGNVACPTYLNPTTATAADPFTTSTTSMNWYNGGGCSSVLGTWNRSGMVAQNCSSWTASTFVYGWSTTSSPSCHSLNIAAKDLCSSFKAGDFSAFYMKTYPALGDNDFAYAPGDYSYQLGSAAATSVTLAEGSLSEVAIQLPVDGQLPPLFNVALILADPRALPDARPTTITSSVSGERAYTLPSTASGTVNLKAYVNSSARYTLSVNGRTLTLDQTQANSITLKRVDVDDVIVTREDNSTYTVRGTYELYFGGSRIAGPYSTNSGVDMLPGDYELVVKFTTAEGDQVQHYTFTL
jgi:hypothetical protein